MSFMYPDGHHSPQICVDVCAFEGTVSLFRLASVGKDIHLKVAVRVPAGWNAVPLVHGKAWWHNLHAATSAEVNISANCRRSSVANTMEDLCAAVVARAIRLLRDYYC